MQAKAGHLEIIKGLHYVLEGGEKGVLANKLKMSYLVMKPKFEPLEKPNPGLLCLCAFSLLM